MNKIFLFLCIVALSSFTACSDEPDGPKDKTAPVITLLSPTTADFYQDDLLISASAVDDETVTAMEIYVDGTQIDKQLADAIGYTLNTKQFQDGDHILKIIAKDKAGNEGIVEQTITLLNTVVTLNLTVNNLLTNVEYYFYLLDEDGAVVEDQFYQVTSTSTKINFSTPENHAVNKKYALAYFEHEGVNGVWPPTNRLSIVTGYTQGTYNQLVGNITGAPNNQIGTHTFIFQNLPNPLLMALHTETTTEFPTLVNSTKNLILTKNNTTAFMAIRPDFNQAPLYKIFSGLNAGETTPVSDANFTAMSGSTIPTSPDATYSFSFVFGIKTEGEYLNPSLVWAHNPYVLNPVKFEFQMYYPGNQFPEYLSGMLEVSPDHEDQYNVFGQTAPTTFKRLSAQAISLNKSAGVFTLHTTGTYDFVQLQGGHQSTDGLSVNYTWSITLPNNNNLTYKLPEVPHQLTDMFDYPTSSEWNTSVGVVFTDYSGLVGYNDYFEKTFKNAPTTVNFNGWGKHSREWLTSYTRFTPTGGRIRSPESSLKDFAKSEIWTRMLQNTSINH